MTHIVWWGWPKIKQGEDHGVAMYKEFFPEGPDFTYHYDIRTLPLGEGAVLVINTCISEQTAGARGIIHPARLEDYICKMPWVILLIAQDEDAHTRFDTWIHPKMRIWVQIPKPPITPSHPGLAWAAKCGPGIRQLPMGYDSEFNSLALPFFQPSFISRPINWLFKGECALPRHGEWLTELQRLANHPQPLKTDHCAFLQYEGHAAECIDDGSRVPIEQYIKLHTDAKVVICRPEGWNPCPARLFYVLQAGCVPIVSEKPSTRGAWYDLYDWTNWWEYMLGEKPPFPIVKDVNDLERTLQQALNEWPQNAQRIYAWWIDYKVRLGASLRAEIQEMER